jgi:hypothetical protein
MTSTQPFRRLNAFHRATAHGTRARQSLHAPRRAHRPHSINLILAPPMAKRKTPPPGDRAGIGSNHLIFLEIGVA